MKKALLLLMVVHCAQAVVFPDHIKQMYHSINPWKHVDFDESMQTEKYRNAIGITRRVVGIDGRELMEQFRSLFNKNNLSYVVPDTRPRIPKIIHQIWLGGDVPEAFESLMQGWVDAHFGRGWRYKLWTDKEAAAFGLQNQKYYDETDNYGVKSDLLKWEIIYRYGGVYVDVDFECLCPLDILHYSYDFYVGIQPLDTQYVQLGAALFAAHRHHPILKHCIDTIKDDWHHKGAPAKSGPVHFTKSFFKTACDKSSGRVIALPATYMYPLGCRQKELKIDEWIANGAYAVHHWAKSWMPKNYRPRQFRSLNNDDSCASWND